MLRMCAERLAHRYARTRRAIPMLVVVFFCVLKKDIGKFCSLDRVINAPCDSSAPRFLAARAELHFQSFLRFLLRVIFRQFFSLSTTLSSSPSSSTRRYHLIIKICCQYVMKSSKLVNTQKMVKNGCF
jgi:hypothetical protein